MKLVIALAVATLAFCSGCQSASVEDGRIPVILDTDANNELDDQHAIAYLLMNQEVFDIVGITVNTTKNGGLIEGHYQEALRILTLFNEQEKIALKKGADGSFSAIRSELNKEVFDGSEAVDFIIAEAKKKRNSALVLLPIGKLTNIALAIEKAPEIAKNIRVVWLGSNYPEPGEYNLENDISSLQYLLDADVHFEIVTVSYGRNTGTSDITVSVPEIDSVMPGMGPHIEGVITGRHGGEFSNFGDYAVNLWHHIDVYGDPPSRALFDLGAVAIVKNPAWAKPRTIPAPQYDSTGWVERPDNSREIILWEHFDRNSIVEDLYKSLGQP